MSSRADIWIRAIASKLSEAAQIGHCRPCDTLKSLFQRTVLLETQPKTPFVAGLKVLLSLKAVEK